MRRRLVPACLLLLAALFAVPASAQQNPDFWLQNQSGRTVAEVYVWGEGQSSWGPDRLGQNVLGNGQQIAIRPPRGGCIFDIRIVYADGAVEERRRVNTCVMDALVLAGPAGQARPPGVAGTQPQPAPGRLVQGPNPDFRLVNRSSRVITEVYVSSSEDRAWGPDRLGRDVLRAGQSMIVTLPRDGTCVFDIRVVYNDGSATERRRINTCNITELIFP